MNPTKETVMSKGQRGNKEAKKPKKPKNVPAPIKPPGSTGAMSTVAPPKR
jgi:hypothetical protein